MRKTKKKQFSIETSVISKNDDGIVSVLDFRNTDNYYEITGPAAVAWQKINDGCDEDQIVEFVAKKFDAPKAQVAAGFRSFVRKMTDIGFLNVKK